MRFHVITLFPEMISAYVNESILARAQEKKVIEVKTYQLRNFVKGKKYRTVWPDGNVRAQVDDRPFGGGPGMVLRAEPFLEAVRFIEKKLSKKKGVKTKVVFFSPSGKQFDTSYSKKTASSKVTDIIFLCGRYEGIDARVKKILKAEEISVGPYVLTGGEIPAMIMIDSISRQIPGVLGKHESLEETRVSSSEMYTRPEVLEYSGKKHKVPKVLLSGNHKMIDEWKLAKKNKKE